MIKKIIVKPIPDNDWKLWYAWYPVTFTHLSERYVAWLDKVWRKKINLGKDWDYIYKIGS